MSADGRCQREILGPMPLVSGSRLGAYEVTAMLGVGGMGEVYRARDTKLGRSVAIKVLPEMFLSDADRIARFEREAKVLASLNHPHIAALYGMEESVGRHFLVMELVEGETLAERLQSVAPDQYVASDFSRTRSSPAEAGRHVPRSRCTFQFSAVSWDSQIGCRRAPLRP